ncbi:unnamed protein product, partial [Prorocentrum cordatum]
RGPRGDRKRSPRATGGRRGRPAETRRPPRPQRGGGPRTGRARGRAAHGSGLACSGPERPEQRRYKAESAKVRSANHTNRATQDKPALDSFLTGSGSVDVPNFLLRHAPARGACASSSDRWPAAASAGVEREWLLLRLTT